MPRGKIAEIAGAAAAAAVPGVAAIHFNLQPGDEVGPLEDKDCRPGYVVSLAKPAAEVIAIALDAVSLIRVRLMAANSSASPDRLGGNRDETFRLADARHPRRQLVWRAALRRVACPIVAGHG